MKRHACRLCLVMAALAASHVAPAGDIVRCVDRTGRVTLTDQPCAEGETGAVLGRDEEREADKATGPAVEHYPAPHALPRARPVARQGAQHMRMPRDVATLKEARMQWLLMDGAGKPRLAGVN